MNIKYYLRGLGIGLVITTLILTISHHISNPKENEEQTQPQTTAGSVIAYTKEDKTKDQEETTKQPSQPTTQQIQQTENNDGNTEITIDIQGVYYGTDVSDLLYDAGVITDKQEFSDYLKEHGYDTIIREGSYTFTKGDTFENLAKIITRSE